MALPLPALLATLALGPMAWAQTPPGAAPAASAARGVLRPVAAPAATPAAARAATEMNVIEDDNVRIEETRQRGQLARVTVSPKGSTLGSYEINVGARGRDPSQDKSGAGQRVWSVLRF